MDNLAYKMPNMYISNRLRTSGLDKSKKVCFYGRVSTQHEEQVNALSNQLQWYDSILAQHPNWGKSRSICRQRCYWNTKLRKRGIHENDSRCRERKV